MALTSIVTVAEINPWAVGGTAFGILVFLLLVLLGFAGGREHS